VASRETRLLLRRVATFLAVSLAVLTAATIPADAQTAASLGPTVRLQTQTGAGMAGLLALTFSNDTMVLLAATSPDGATLTAAPGMAPYTDPYGRGVRDPSLARSGGRFVAAYTSPPFAAYLARSTSWSVAASADLNRWSFLADVPMTSIPGVTHVWAPDLLVDTDGSVYSYVAVSADGAVSFQTYVMKALDSSLTRWSAPTLVAGLGANTIDATVRRVGVDYVMFFKDETARTISRARASSPLGPFTLEMSGNWMGIAQTPVEGPALIQLPDGRYRLFYDAYTINQLRYVDSVDLNTWTAPQNLRYPWPQARHLGLLWLTASELAAVTSAPPRWPDFTGDGASDVLARDGAGRLWLYPGNGRGGWLPRRQVGAGWQIFNAIVGAGDRTGDGASDVLARDGAGRLWLYPGNGRGGWLPRRQVGAGWQIFNALT